MRTTTPVVVGSRFPAWLIMLFLFGVTFAVYWPVLRCDFINYDDDLYVTSNVQVQNGLTWASIKWAFSHTVAFNWHPLTMLSHMLDCQCYGLKPWGHHLTSVVIHALNGMLVFVVLRQLTGAVWRSFWVAALFSLHPLRVESVAWVAERKDVLSGFFGLLTLIFYVCYVERLKIRQAKYHIYYGLALIFFAGGLLSKAMLVTWPFVMLLLDYWPLGRFQRGNAWSLVKEKIPFLALAVLTSVVTLIVQKQEGAVKTFESLPLGARAANALISYGRYLGKIFWPTDLAVFYPHPGYWPMVQVLLAGGLILGITGLFWSQRQRFPFLLMGWLWYCGTLVPVIGLVQVGEQSMADRYTYLPSLGLLILLIWGMAELVQRWHQLRIPLLAAGAVVLVLCLQQTRQQLGYWHTSETLFEHAQAVTQNNALAHINLGAAYGKEGRVDEAISQFQDALRIQPGAVRAHHNLGLALDQKGRIDDAIDQFAEAQRLKPDDAGIRNDLGSALNQKQQTDEAIAQFKEALRLNPDFAEAHANLGAAYVSKGDSHDAMAELQEAVRLEASNFQWHLQLGAVLDKEGRVDEAISQFQEAVRLKPDDGKAHQNLGINLNINGQLDQAIREFQEAIRLEPDNANSHYLLGFDLASQGNLDQAVGQYQEALRLKPDDAGMHNDLGNALDSEGRRDEAIQQFREAIRLKPDFAEAHQNLGADYGNQGKVDEALREFEAAVRLQPDDAKERYNLGIALDQKGRTDEAIRQYQEAVRLKPDFVEARTNLDAALLLKTNKAVR
jgi:tetratricopeptide (TPR) repeat protein